MTGYNSLFQNTEKIKRPVKDTALFYNQNEYKNFSHILNNYLSLRYANDRPVNTR